MNPGRWLTWQPSSAAPQIGFPVEPTKPSKPGSDGFDGSSLGRFQNIGASDRHNVDRAVALLIRTGARIMRLDFGFAVGVWSDLDSLQVRAAIEAVGMGALPVLYLDGDVPSPYKLRRVPGEPVPATVRLAMEREPATPWTVRDRLLRDMGWRR